MFAGLKKVTSKTKPSLQGTEGEKMTNNLLRSGYSLVVTSGQRKYGGPPPGWEGSRPGNGCEVSLSSQHSHFFTLNSGVLWEDSQHHLRGGAHPPLGEVWADLGAEADDGSRDWSQQVREMSADCQDCNLHFLCSRGYAFITFTKREEALEAVRQVNI